MDKIIAQLMKLAELEDTGRIARTSVFWSCECKEEFLHLVTDELCIECGATRDSQPDARVSDVVGLILNNTEVT